MERNEKKRFRKYYLSVDNLSDEEIVNAWNRVNPDSRVTVAEIDSIRRRQSRFDQTDSGPSPETIRKRCQEVLRNRSESEGGSHPSRSLKGTVTIPCISCLGEIEEDDCWFGSGGED